MRRLISSGSPFEAAGGYSRAVVDGEWVFVAGTTGLRLRRDDDRRRSGRADAPGAAQYRAALAEAGASLADVVRVRYYVPDAADWPHIMPVLGEAFATIRPAATALICGLVDPRMKIEIEVTARRARTAREPTRSAGAI